MTRFYFEIKSANILDCIWAESIKDAQHQLMNSGYAPFYRQIQFLNGNPASQTNEN